MMQYLYPEQDNRPKGGGHETVSREVQADGSVIETVERILPDGSKIIEETVLHNGGQQRRSSGASRPTNRPSTDEPLPPQRGNVISHNQHIPQRRNVVSHNQQSPGNNEPPHSVGCCGDVPTFGASAKCPPQPPPYAKEGAIKWAWFPEWSWLRILKITCLFVAVIGLLLLIGGAISSNAGLIAGGVVLLLIGAIGFYVVFIWMWNAGKQEAYRLARGKRVEAVALWENVDPQFSYVAKDAFFETAYGGKTLRVLRNGTIEMHGYHRNTETGLSAGMGMSSAFAAAGMSDV